MSAGQAGAGDRIADRLAAAGRGRFVGRAAELDRFRAALLAPEPPFVALHLHGPGGVGKTTLIGEFARVAGECGRAVVRLDGRDIEPSPTAFVRACRAALGLPEGEDTPPWPPDCVLLIDTYETLAALDRWLRERFLPQLPARGVVVLAGREPPASPWRTDLGWAALTAFVPLANLSPEEGATYLAARGIGDAGRAAALAFTRGHPLALALIADALGRGDDPAAFDPRGEPEVIRVLLERLVREVPSARHRLALEACAIARVTTEALIAEALQGDAPPGDDARALFAWLRRLSFIEHGPYGVFPHDLAREVLAAEVRWRDRAAYIELSRRIYAHLRRRIAGAVGLERQRLQLEALYALRHRRFMRAFFDWEATDGVYAESATPGDAAAIVAMVRVHEGDASAAIAAHWLARQPGAFLAFRGRDGTLSGFMAHLALHRATADDAAVDPAVAPMLDFIARHGPVGPGEEVALLRFWMDREAYQAITAAINLTAMNIVTQVLTQPTLAWNFVAMADPDFWVPHFSGVNWPRAPEADYAVGGSRFGVFAHDWRVEPPVSWMAGEPTPMPFDPARAAGSPPAAPPLSKEDHARAVRQALRDFHRPERLAASPLLRAGGDAEALRGRLREAVAALRADPRDAKLHRAIWHTFIEPAPTQERAAELLGLPFNTYRYRLNNGIARVADWLWRREREVAR